MKHKVVLTEDEVGIVDWLVHHDGTTLEYAQRCRHRGGWKLSEAELPKVLQSLILKQWVIEKDKRYFVDERRYS